MSAYPIAELCSLRHDDGNMPVVHRAKAIIALAEDQVGHDVVREPIAPLAHIPRCTPVLVRRRSSFLSCV